MRGGLPAAIHQARLRDGKALGRSGLPKWWEKCGASDQGDESWSQLQRSWCLILTITHEAQLRYRQLGDCVEKGGLAVVSVA